jgi:lipopolysaccharide biosynthesis protein
VSRLAVMAHYDPSGSVAPHVRRQVEALRAGVDQLVVVTTAKLGDRERSWLSDRSHVVERDNIGYDFYSYKTGLDLAGDLSVHDEVVICNDTYVGPLRPYAAIFEAMATRPVDFWGLTGSQRVSPHVQSFFVAFRPWVVDSSTFRKFWNDMVPINDRFDVIHTYEVGLSTVLHDAGFRWSSYYRETPEDVRIARQRVRWWAMHRRRLPRTTKERRFLLQSMRVPWNPVIGLADVALDDGRLPLIKIDTLRYDPYGLGADQLLDLAEQRYPAAFEGVRDYLDRTRHLYPPREADQLFSTPAPVRPLRRAVEYGRAV